MLLIIATARADTPIHLSHDAAPDVKVVIHNVKGDVRVTGWNQNRVEVDGSLGSGAQPLQITGDAHALEIRVQAASKSTWFGFSSDSGMGATT
ncbi:MAG: hypothetical protein C4338_06965, partial [Rhodanobacteraceae bacterium]